MSSCEEGHNFWFLNRRKEPYEWTDEVPEDDWDYQGLLEEPAPYPDLSAELPGVLLEDKDIDLHMVTDDPEPNFADLAAAALDNAGTNAHDRLQAAQQGPGPTNEPTLVEADNDKIVYEITFDMPDAGLGGANVVPADHNAPQGGPAAVATVHDLATETVDFLTDTDNTTWRYPTQLRRSVNRYSPQATFLQLVRCERTRVLSMLGNIQRQLGQRGCMPQHGRARRQNKTTQTILLMNS